MAPGIQLATGDRFTQLLEAKLNLDHQPNGNDIPASLLPNQPISHNLLPTTSSSSSNISSYPYDHVLTPPPPPPPTQFTPLAIETALHDFSQVQIQPDWVAPMPPSTFIRWPGDPAWEVFPTQGETTAGYLAPFAESMAMGFTSGLLPNPAPYPVHPASTVSSGTNASFRMPANPSNPVAWQPAQPIPPTRTSLGTRPTTANTPAFQPFVPSSPAVDPLPPLLKIRVHETQHPATPGPSRSNCPSRLPARQHERKPDGSWALEMLKPFEARQPELTMTPRPTPTSSPVTPRKRSKMTVNVPLKTANGISSVAKGKRKAEDSSPTDMDEPRAHRGQPGEQKAGIACFMCRARKLKYVFPV